MRTIQGWLCFSDSFRVPLIMAFTVQAVHIWTMPYTTLHTLSGSWWETSHTPSYKDVSFIAEYLPASEVPPNNIVLVSYLLFKQIN